MPVRTFPIGCTVRLAGLALDPYPILKRLQSDEPVSWVDEVRMWFVTRRSDVVTVLSDRVAFTTDDSSAPLRDTFGNHMLSTEGEQQARFKRQCFPRFRPAAVVEAAEPLIREVADTLIDGFLPAGRTDLARSFASTLAIQVIARVLGLNVSDLRLLRGWYNDFAAALGNFQRDPQVRERGHESVERFAAHARERIEALRAAPDASLLSVLVHAPEPERLGEADVISNALLILFGGIETTESMILNALWALLSHPAQCEEVRANAALIPAAIEESMRWETPVQSCTRHATRTYSLRGVEIGGGDTVQCMLGAANRDPEYFSNPETFDIHRSNAGDHLSFGYGAHFCLGAALARSEARIALESLFRQLPGLRLDPAHTAAPRGHEFRKPPALAVLW